MSEMCVQIDIPEDRCVELFSTADALDSCHRAFLHYGSGTIENPPRSEEVRQSNGMDLFRLDMPAEWPGTYRARKCIEERSDVASGRLAARQAYIELEDVPRGSLVRLDAGHITDMRTGAAGALGLQYMATRAIRRLAILGTGRVARTLALACDTLFELTEIRCTSRNQEKRDAFARQMSSKLRASLHMTETQSECLQGVDALLTAVPTPQPILDVADVEQIDYLVIVGGDGRTRQVESLVLERRSVVVDLLEQAEKSGEFRWARSQQAATEFNLVRADDGRALTIGDAAHGRVRMPRGCVYLTGLAVQDLCAAAVVYERWRARSAT